MAHGLVWAALLLAAWRPGLAAAETVKDGHLLGVAPDGSFAYVHTVVWEKPVGTLTEIQVRGARAEPLVTYSLCIGRCGLEQAVLDQPAAPPACSLAKEDAAARQPTPLCRWEVRGAHPPLRALALRDADGGPRPPDALAAEIEQALRLAPAVRSTEALETHKRQRHEKAPCLRFYLRQPWGLALLHELGYWSCADGTAQLFESPSNSALLFMEYRVDQTPHADSFRDLRWISRQRIEAMRLYHLAWSVWEDIEASTVDPRPLPAADEKRAPATRQPGDSAWLKLSLRDAQGFAVQRVRYVAKTARGDSIEGKTSMSGTAELDGLPAGEVEVRFPDFDHRGWRGASALPTTERPTVHKSDGPGNLPAVAWRHGFADWKLLARGRKVRPPAKVEDVAPGDEIAVPARQPPVYRFPTNHEASITVERPQKRLSVDVAPEESDRYDAKKSTYTLQFTDGHERKTIQGHMRKTLPVHVEESLPLSAFDVELHAMVASADGEGDYPMDWPLSFRGLAGTDTEEGDWARLECASERGQVAPALAARHARLLDAVAKVEQALAIETDFHAARTLHLLLLAAARVPWEAARTRAASIAYRKGDDCFGAGELDHDEARAEDPGLWEYADKPDFEAWRGKEYARHSAAHK